LKELPDSDLKNYLLQLVQALKYEPYHDSPLARFLITRALQQRTTIGQYFFWHIKAEMHVPEISERYALILETFLRGCGQDLIEELLKQQDMIVSFYQMARDCFEKGSNSTRRKEILRKHLQSLDIPAEGFCIPVNPRYTIRRDIENCIEDSIAL
jgi:phosphatidylinositol-4,5-bisphosphate 3-kinase